MAFEPENRLEQIMVLAASRPAARLDFFRALMEAELIVPGSVGETLVIETVMTGGKPYHPLFTSMTRLRAFSEEPVAHFKIVGRTLFEAARGASFVLNPRSDLGKLMVPEEIEYWLDQLYVKERGGGLIVGQPAAYPKKLIQALCVLFMSRQLVRAAHLAYVAREGSRLPAHPLIGVVADGDNAKLAHEIFEAASTALPNTPLDVMVLDDKNPRLPLEKHLLSVAPFYQRTYSLTSN
jgi:hypothetical protein